MLHSHTIYFLVNSKTEVNLLDRKLMLFFEPVEKFKKKLIANFSRIIWCDDGTCTAITDNGVIDFYFGDEEIIEKFVMADVQLTEEPLIEVSKLCKKYGWLLYHMESEKYLQINESK